MLGALLCLYTCLLTPTLGAVIGFSLDIEPSVGAQSVAFVNTLAAWRTALQPTGLLLSVDAGTAWSSSPDWVTTVNGTSKLLSEWLVDLSDEAILMDYDRNASKLLARALPYLSYADRRGKAVTVGLALAPPGAASTWWQCADLVELEALVASVHPALAQHASFTQRYALFHAGTLWNSSTANVTLVNEEKTLWYLVDDWIYNASARQDFLALAARQRIVQVYDAPHAGSRPHIGASASDEALYRSFVQITHAQGIDIQFMSGLANLPQDLAFIKSTGLGQRPSRH